MNKEDKYIDNEIEKYFQSAGNMKCPGSMKKNLYNELNISPGRFFTFPKLATGLTLVFAASIIMKISVDSYQQRQIQQQIDQAETEMQIAMHYFNRVSMKSLSAVNNNGIRPAIIKPLSKTGALL